MDIKVDVTIPYAREAVFVAYRDRLQELRKYLPNIRDAKLVEREEKGTEVRLVNEWVGGGDIPAAARSVLKESMLRWTDHATWSLEALTCTWRTDVHAFPDALKCSGQHRFVEVAPASTRIEFRGALTCDAS